MDVDCWVEIGQLHQLPTSIVNTLHSVTRFTNRKLANNFFWKFAVNFETTASARCISSKHEGNTPAPFHLCR